MKPPSEAARTQTWSLLSFRDPAKNPLGIVLAATANAEGSIITQVADVEDADHAGATGAFGYALSVPMLTLTQALRDAPADEASARIIEAGPVTGVTHSLSGGAVVELPGRGHGPLPVGGWRAVGSEQRAAVGCSLGCAAWRRPYCWPGTD
ncbi:hypothetical protein [Streptomyces sp. MST-110588]|uniref:hypothetical protein n=1 Tax=Streptomyces sp. MST-110588 TaxID=2833628 RepID=UPI001F5DA2A3|nr:hypothetical protein [Streptomyces sp. MST-110588]